MSKQGMCRICKKRPPWEYKNCPPNVCKQCYHRHVWADLPAARKQRQLQATADALHDLVSGDVLVFDDVPEVGDDLVDDEALVDWLTGPEFVPPSLFLGSQRELHFHITLQTNDTQRHRDLIQNLYRLQCAVTTMDGGTIVGYLEYNPRSSSDRKATAGLHKLLNRWQRKGHLTWTASRKT